TVLVRGKIARRREEESPGRPHRRELPVGTKKSLLNDLFRRLTGPDETHDVAVQRLAALGKELRESLLAGLGRRRHSGTVPLTLRPKRPFGNSLRRSGGFRPLGGHSMDVCRIRGPFGARGVERALALARRPR